MPSTKKTPKKPSPTRPKQAGKIAVVINPPMRWTPAGSSRGSFPGGSKSVKPVRNPWTPEDIVIFLKFAVTYQAGKYLIELIKLWMEHRRAQKIEIKVGDNELKIEGHVSDKVLEKKIERFRELIKGATYDDIEVALPKGARRNIPAKLADRRLSKGGDK
jgi:hypothetical protein